MKKGDILKEIIARKKERIAAAKQAICEEELKIKAAGCAPVRPFGAAIAKPRVISLIAEIKKASPSKGVIRENFDPRQIATIYEECDVQAISVLTEEDHFMGSLSYISEVKSVVTKPVLRKDFILEPYQVYESRVFGADAILLIARLLAKDALSELKEIAESLRMECLIEVHDEKDVKKALGVKAPLIGINNRDLSTLEVDLKTTERIFPLIPKEKIIVVESGIKTHQDVLFLKILGISAVLVGEAFMEGENIRAKVEEVMGW